MDRKARFSVSVQDRQDATGAIVFSFESKKTNTGLPTNGEPHAHKRLIVSVRQDGDQLAFDWSATPDPQGETRSEIETEIAARLKDRTAWIRRVTALVDQVEQWAKELNWSTRRVEKKLDDAFVGRHRVPALLMQEDTCRVMLEPVGRSTPNSEGVVDLYLMPAYDDIASFYYYGDQWHLHYFVGSESAASIREAGSRVLSKEALERILAEMCQHAA